MLVALLGCARLLAATNSLEELVPEISGAKGYVTSKACVECHQEEHASWHRSYHRTMTQLATPANLEAKFDGTEIDSDGLKYRVFQKGEELWVEMPDPDVMMFMVQGGRKIALDKIPRIETRVLMSTGSHHYHTFWVGSPRYPKLMQTLPLVYLIEDKKWVPREAAFMRGDKERFITQWNHHCIRCHSTGGNPGLNDATGMLETSVGEFGIACEACHGPGQKHVELRRAEKLREIEKVLNDPIVNPKKLDSKRSAQVCGQCHGVFVQKDEFAMDFAHHGIDYFPGGDLHRTRYYIQHPAGSGDHAKKADLEKNPDFFRERWWPDGTVLAGGREFTALSASACFTKGTLSCLSCHSMHESEPNDQLKRFATENAQCTQCHQEAKYTTELAKHTFHLEKSTGSNCLNCHMPHTTYALLKGIRSHQIAAPSPAVSAKHGTPNACNLCHLDKSLGWTQEHFAKWYGKQAVELSQENKTVSAAVLWLTKGDAAQRVITAWHLGWEPARAISGTGWMPFYLGLLLNDPYGVVRYVAAKSLRADPAHKVEYDFMAPAADRKRAIDAVFLEASRRTNAPKSAVLVDDRGQWEVERVKAFLRQRDNRPVSIKE